MASELEVFVLVAESGGFARAARRLRITPSAVSRRVAQLEDRVGVQLLSRTTRRVELTTAGEAYFKKIKPLLEEIDSATNDLGKFTPVPAGQLVVSAPAALIERKLIGYLNEYLTMNPQMTIEMVPSEMGPNENHDLTIQSLASSEKDKVSIRLAANPWTVCASPEYLSRHGAPIHPRELRSHQCLTLSTHPHWQFQVDDRELTILPPTRLISFGIAIHKAAISGLGIARLAAFLINDDLANGRLVSLLNEFQASKERTLFLVADSEKITLAKYASFTEFLRMKFARGF